MALVEHGYSNPSSSLPCILGYALWSYLYHILIISRGLHEFKSIFTKKFPEKNFHAKRLHMNERIRELAKQANTIGDWGEDITEGRYFVYPSIKNLEKFAELIVRECIDVHVDDYGVDIIGDVLKKHFGVEE
jgi:hypothetical protein